jgi:hypothetical protein
MLVYERVLAGERILVALNFSPADEDSVVIPAGYVVRLLLSSANGRPGDAGCGRLVLRPNEVVIILLF